jgi:hypothetical protein
MTHKWGHLEEVEHGLFLAWENFSQILRDPMLSSHQAQIAWVSESWKDD